MSYDFEATSIAIMFTKITVEWLALLFHIWEVTGSDLVPETGYPD
jgi:hypothetical protein